MADPSKRQSTTQIGRLGEQYAVRVLTAQGYNIVETNWRCVAGEIDIVAQEGQTWVFVEVKSRRFTRFGEPEEAITPPKQRRMLRCAQCYIAQHNLEDVVCRLDVVAIVMSKSNQIISSRLYRDAVHGYEHY